MPVRAYVTLGSQEALQKLTFVNAVAVEEEVARGQKLLAVQCSML